MRIESTTLCCIIIQEHETDDTMWSDTTTPSYILKEQAAE